MNPIDLDSDRHLGQLRDALRREADQIDPIGLGLETVKRRGRRRRNRGRTAIAVGSAVCVAAAGVSAFHREGGGSHLAFRTRPGSEPAPKLDFRVIAGTVDGGSTHFTTNEGLTYELSTAPGSAVAGADPGQAIYSTRDGEHWTTVDQSKPWIADLTEGDGVLYAIGTAPGAAAGDVSYHLATSHDGGQAWSNSDLPFDLSVPSATVSMSRSATVQVARGTSTTAVLLSEQFWPALDSIVAADFPGRKDVGTRQAADGFAMIDLSQCQPAKAALVSGRKTAAAVVSRLKASCENPPVLGTITWSEIGLSGPGDLVREQMLVSTDGTHWDTVSAPDGVVARDLVATSHGFVLLADDGGASGAAGVKPAGTALFGSTDARQWTAIDTPAGLNVEAIAGDDIVGADATGDVQTSTDAGASWNATSISAQLPAGAPAAMATGVDAGPLGFAVLVSSDANPKDGTPGHNYLLFSTDGVDWGTTDLAANGEPAGGYPISVTVGADHVAVDYQSAGTDGDPVSKLTTLLGTPQR